MKLQPCSLQCVSRLGLGVRGVIDRPGAVLDEGCAPVGAFAGNAEAAAFHMTEEQCVGARDAALLQNGKALTSEGTERLTNLSPTQMLVERLCSSR
jgi:hypothetical protein